MCCFKGRKIDGQYLLKAAQKSVAFIKVPNMSCIPEIIKKALNKTGI